MRRAKWCVALVLATGLVAAGCRGWPGPGHAPGVRLTPHAAPQTVDRFTRFQATADLSPQPANPFDPAQADVSAVFADPHGLRQRAIAFWYQAYDRELDGGRERLTPSGAPTWMVRFTPPAAGVWQWWWEARTPAGIIRSWPRLLRVNPSADPGFIRRSPNDSRYLVHDDGSPYFAVGENLGWYDKRGTFAYDSWLDRLAGQGATFARLWMPSWGFGIEWSDTGLGDYRNRLDRAWQLDTVMDAAAARGIAVELSLLNHGAFSTAFNSEWAANPYNQANGGPLATPGEFFTSPEARRLFSQRLRYIVARWGSATNLLDWELWNEVDLTDGYSSATVAAWHRDVAEELRSLDPARHLVSTSFAVFANDPTVWRDSGLDFTQLHFYSRIPVQILPDLASDIATWIPQRVADYDRPALFAELGVDSSSGEATRAADPDGIGVHDGLWAAPMVGSFGTAMTWWWDTLVDVEPDRYYPMFGSVARFLSGVDWDQEGFAPAVASATSAATARPLTVHGLVGARRALLWVKDQAYQWYSPARVPIADAALTLDGLAPGAWCGAWWDTWAGAEVGAPVRVDGGSPARLDAPTFTGDVALRLAPCS
jgi:hypothetical protein